MKTIPLLKRCVKHIISYSHHELKMLLNTQSFLMIYTKLWHEINKRFHNLAKAVIIIK